MRLENAKKKEGKKWCRWDSQRSALPLIDHLFYEVAIGQSMSNTLITKQRKKLCWRGIFATQRTTT